MTERSLWEADTELEIVAPARGGKARAAELMEIGQELDLRATQISPRLSYADVVAEAGRLAAWKREVARARWRESSGFAHGRTWPVLQLSKPNAAELIRGGYSFAVTLAENRHRELAKLATALFLRALDDYADAAA
jgi:hypothetical protein